MQAGVPLVWTIRIAPEDLTGCNNELVIPAYNIRKSLQPGDTVISFTPQKSGRIGYSCWMGMIRSQIYVYDDIKDKPKALPGGISIQQRQQSSSCCSGN